MKDFEVLSEAEDSYHIKHKNGKAFTINKKELSPKAMATIQKMCAGGQMASGGRVNPDETAFKPGQKSVAYDEGGAVKAQQEKVLTSSGAAKVSKEDIPQEWLLAHDQQAINNDYQKKLGEHDFEATNIEKNKQLPGTFQGGKSFLPGGLPPQNKAIELPAADQLYAKGGQIPGYTQGGGIPDALNPNAQPLSGALNFQMPAQAPAPPPPAPAPVAPEPPNPFLQQTQQTNRLLSHAQGDVGRYGKTLEGIYGGPQAKEIQGVLKDVEYNEAERQGVQEINQDSDAAFGEHIKNMPEQDQNRYFQQQGTGSKILSAIGLALSGAGAGRYGTNLAAENIKQAIANDIAAQQADKTNALNLYKVNLLAHQNENQAYLTTENQLINVAQAKLNLLGSQAGNAQTQFQLQQMSNDLQGKKIENTLKSNIFGGAAGSNTLGAQVSALVPPAQQEGALKGLGEAQKLQVVRQMWENSFNHLSKQALSGQLSPSDRESAKNSLSGSLQHVVEGRYNKEAADAQADAILPGYTAFDRYGIKIPGTESKDTMKAKFQRGHALFDSQQMQSLAPITPYKPDILDSVKSSGKQNNPATNLNPTQLTAYRWAKQHSDDPKDPNYQKAQAVLKKLKVK